MPIEVPNKVPDVRLWLASPVITPCDSNFRAATPPFRKLLGIQDLASLVFKMLNARDWSRTSTTRRSLAPQASASAYSATRAYIKGGPLLTIGEIVSILNLQIRKMSPWRGF